MNENMKKIAQMRFTTKARQWLTAMNVYPVHSNTKKQKEYFRVEQEEVDDCAIDHENYKRYVSDDLYEESERHRLAMLKIISVPFVRRLNCTDKYDVEMNAEELDFWIANGVDINASFLIDEKDFYDGVQGFHLRFNAIDTETTPLCYAILTGDYDLVRLFLSRNADPNACDIHERSPLDFVNYSYLNTPYVMINLLLRYGLVLPENEQTTSILEHICDDHLTKLLKRNIFYLSSIEKTGETDIFNKMHKDFCANITDEKVQEITRYIGSCESEFEWFCARLLDAIQK